jgi:hypothetical protein
MTGVLSDSRGEPKRVTVIYSKYKKVIEGTDAAKAIGIERMRQECEHFRNWLERLEALSEP